MGRGGGLGVEKEKEKEKGGGFIISLVLKGGVGVEREGGKKRFDLKNTKPSRDSVSRKRKEAFFERSRKKSNYFWYLCEVCGGLFGGDDPGSPRNKRRNNS